MVSNESNVAPPGPASAAKLRPQDIGGPKVKRQYVNVKGKNWSYLDAPAQGPQRGVVVLIHGFPDQSFAWRYQIPLFASLGLRSIAVDCMGYGDTGVSDDLRDYSYKTHADVVAAIARAIGARSVVMGGHDWGGATVYRVAQWYPDLVSHVFSVCTPYPTVVKPFISTRQLSETSLPQFGYQLQFGSEDLQLESVIRDEASMRKFLLGIYGGRCSSGKLFMKPEKGIDLDIIREDEIDMTPLLDQDELDFYVREFTKNGIHGPANWYRTRHINWEEDLALPESVKNTINQPTLYILATKDNVLTRELGASMERSVPNLTRGEVPAGHWALWQTPDQTNAIIKDWLEGVVFGGRNKL